MAAILFFRIWNIARQNQKAEDGYINEKYLYLFIPNTNTNHPYGQKSDLQKTDLPGSYLPDRGYLAISMPGGRDIPFTLKWTLTYYSKPSLLAREVTRIPGGSLCYDDYKLNDKIILMKGQKQPII